ncbi:MAG: glyoxalase [Chloroflexi bacterium]|nr:glyoxalase [Chloroflexota bacterium]
MPKIEESWLAARGWLEGSVIEALLHVQLAIPGGSEEVARDFYGRLLGLREIGKPASLVARGGCWFQLASGQQLHLGVEQSFQPARKAHPAFLCANVSQLRQQLEEAGIRTSPDDLIPGVRRFYCADPFGNRLEFADGPGGPYLEEGARS